MFMFNKKGNTYNKANYKKLLQTLLPYDIISIGNKSCDSFFNCKLFPVFFEK